MRKVSNYKKLINFEGSAQGAPEGWLNSRRILRNAIFALNNVRCTVARSGYLERETSVSFFFFATADRKTGKRKAAIWKGDDSFAFTRAKVRARFVSGNCSVRCYNYHNCVWPCIQARREKCAKTNFSHLRLIVNYWRSQTNTQYIQRPTNLNARS